MTLRILLFALLAIKAFNLNANYIKYHKLLNQARYYTTDKVKKIELFEQAFEEFEPFAEDLLAVGNYYEDLGKYAKAKHYWRKSILYGTQCYPDAAFFYEYSSAHYPELDYFQPIDTAKNEMFVSFLSKKYKKLRTEFINNCAKNTDYEQLLSAENYFQESRGFYFDHYTDTMGYYCSYQYAYIVNSKLFLELLENNSFPKRRKTRRFNSRSILMLFNHVIAGFNGADENVLKLLEFAHEMVVKGELTPWEYTSSYDHYITYNNSGKSVYGTRFFLNENNEQCVTELMYPEKVDSLREAIGLVPLRLWCKNFNFKLPINYE